MTTYRTADGSWVAVSTSTQSVAERVMTLVGRPELAEEAWFADGAGRAAVLAAPRRAREGRAMLIEIKDMFKTYHVGSPALSVEAGA